MKSRFVLRALAASLVTLAAAGCTSDEESATTEGTMRSDGYALFAVENERQQRNDVTVTVREADPGATYVLLYSERPPRNVGWFLFDPSTKSRCGGSTGPHCEVPGFGHMVDVVTVPEGASEVVLRDERCGCNADSDESSWTGHWAILRVERTDRTNALTFDVRALKVRGYASEPKVDQLQ
ncbi:MAG: hypothetical protein KIS78_24965 [Labilithrix sp.]|nr:hypothetical protein [Labilithrix sp.]MCW5835676.1 hypothetical protein [Labilithrix sp.]